MQRGQMGRVRKVFFKEVHSKETPYSSSSNSHYEDRKNKIRRAGRIFVPLAIFVIGKANRIYYSSYNYPTPHAEGFSEFLGMSRLRCGGTRWNEVCVPEGLEAWHRNQFHAPTARCNAGDAA